MKDFFRVTLLLTVTLAAFAISLPVAAQGACGNLCLPCTDSAHAGSGSGGNYSRTCVFGNSCIVCPSPLVGDATLAADEILTSMVHSTHEDLVTAIDRYRNRVFVHADRRLLAVTSSCSNTKLAAVAVVSVDRLDVLQTMGVRSLGDFYTTTDSQKNAVAPLR